MARTTGEQVGTGESGKLLPGRYHAVIQECNEHRSKEGNEGFHAEIVVLNGTSPGMEGKTLKYCYFHGAKLYDLAAAIALTDFDGGQTFTAERLKQMRADAKAKKPVAGCDFRANEASGRQLVIEVVNGKPKQDGQVWPELGFGVWSVFDPAVDDVPRDVEFMRSIDPNWQPKAKTAGGANGGASNGTNGHHPQAQGQQAVAAGSSAGGMFD